MPWNGPDYSLENPWASPDLDLTRAPWANGIMTLTHEEVLHVLGELPSIEDEYLPDTLQVIARFNQLTDYAQAINGDTYNCIKGYDPEIHTLGINENGIVTEGGDNGDSTND